MMQVDPKHARQKSLFYISDDIDSERDVVAMHNLVNEVGQWVIAAGFSE
jgi:hypothetical protein